MLVYEELLVDLGFGECTDRNEAVAIRDRERKLAGLANMMVFDLLRYRGISFQKGQEWLRRYEEALK